MTNLTLNLNAKLQPMHRHDLEDALQEILETLDFKAETTGGGTMQAPNGEIESCDIELSISDSSEENINKIIEAAEAMLSPIGSKLIIYPEDESKDVVRIPFGSQEGLGLYLNSNDLDDEVYKNCDVNYIYEEIERLLGDFKTGHIASYWEGEETSLYLYGESFDEMHTRIKPLLDSYPLCQKCRVVKIA
ncbi:hypothetical protein M4I21_05230 [Cellulophaga sp. 20_2_10]|uniref:hypothetical protein n=1 Tax=Cellulophaga sp. 20_2_10 TaxID=2942476 RepID=UPI00201ABAF0|nr:hypothetical protein [Cellulophaga sp. 20_2_10]MCL5245201.1 hypothetical protein [Cellulophaga sp. 20_2_10]